MKAIMVTLPQLQVATCILDVLSDHESPVPAEILEAELRPILRFLGRKEVTYYDALNACINAKLITRIDSSKTVEDGGMSVVLDDGFYFARTDTRSDVESLIKGFELVSEQKDQAPMTKENKPAKKAAAIRIYRESVRKGLERRHILARYQDELGLTLSQARAFCWNIKKGYDGWTEETV